MIIDSELAVSLNQAVTASAASTHIIDAGKAGEAIDRESHLIILCKVAAESTGDFEADTTVLFSLQTATDEAFTSPVTLWASDAIPKATLVPGYTVVRVRIPIGSLRYLRVYYEVAAEDLTAGEFDANIVRQHDLNQP